MLTFRTTYVPAVDFLGERIQVVTKTASGRRIQRTFPYDYALTPVANHVEWAREVAMRWFGAEHVELEVVRANERGYTFRVIAVEDDCNCTPWWDTYGSKG